MGPVAPATEEVVVVAVPFPAQGHLNQLLHFSLLLAARGLSVHYACSATHNRQATHRIQGWHADAVHAITFHDLTLSSFPTPPPDPNAATNFPAHLQPLWDTVVPQLRAPLAALFHSVSPTTRRLVVVHDQLMSLAGQEAAELPNAETYMFRCVPAMVEIGFMREPVGKLEPPPPKHLEKFLAPFEECFTREFFEFARSNHYDRKAEAGIINNTCRSIEGEFIDLLTEQIEYRSKKFFAIGPIQPVAGVGGGRHECLEWLDKQTPASVVYVAFGSTTTISDDQIHEMAAGLKQSGQRFILVAKDADQGDIFIEAGDDGRRKRRWLPDFGEEVEGVGMIMGGWAPQLEILGHPSTGAFMSHCGWNSTMEALSNGVPILAWPMHSDQPRNAVMVAEYLKTGVIVRDWARRWETVPAEVIEEAIKKVMVYEEGKEIRRMAKDIGEAVRRAVADGGSSQTDLNSFIAHVTR